MRWKQWLLWSFIALISACSSTPHETAKIDSLMSTPHSHSQVLTGADIYYAPLSHQGNSDYINNGKHYTILQNTHNFTQKGIACAYPNVSNSNITASGEVYSPDTFTAAHRVLPIPSYVRVTNLSNGRQLIVRINDRGPFDVPQCIIRLTPTAAERLRLTFSTPVQLDIINVAADGTLSGPGTFNSKIEKQNFALPSRPDISVPSNTQPLALQTTTNNNATTSLSQTINAAETGSSITTPPQAAVPDLSIGLIKSSTAIDQQTSVATASVSTAKTTTDHTVIAESSTQLTNKQPLNSDASTSTDKHQSTTSTQVLDNAEQAEDYDEYQLPNEQDALATTSTIVKGSNQQQSPRFVLQVGALKDKSAAAKQLESLTTQFSTIGQINYDNGLYRIQLGPFNTRAQALQLMQRLQTEAKLPSYITTP